MGKPCVAAIQGVALGGGMEFALACHWRVAESHARFGQPEIRLRLLPGYGGTQRLPRLLAEKRGPEGLLDALELILGGRSIDGDAALNIGLIETWQQVPMMRSALPMPRCANSCVMATIQCLVAPGASASKAAKSSGSNCRRTSILMKRWR
jgi:enoyl-CoA hydratase/carnithine racemase